MRFFNTAGPIQADIHYNLPPLARWNLAEIESLIAQRKYFVLHAPRQTGKTTCLLALMEHLNRKGDYHCLYVNVEAAQAMREKVEAAMRIMAREVANQAAWLLKDERPLEWLHEMSASGGADVLSNLMRQWCQQLDRPLILFLDEVDALIGDTLISLLRQLRAGYTNRPQAFPQTVILCCVRDVRDYRLRSGDNEIITGGSAFNIKAESLRLGNFSDADIAALMQQHSDTTGQQFTPEAVARVCYLTRGQPWLVNALCYQSCFKNEANRDRTRTITADDIEEAKEALILRRDTHLDQLVDKLKEPRVHRVISPLLASEESREHRSDDVQYVYDLGLIDKTVSGGISIANPIYREVIPRELAWDMQTGMAQEQAWYLRPDGSVDMNRLLAAFQQFFRENSESWLECYQYKEAGPQLLMQAFLQRIINGGGQIDREYGLGRRRTDLLVRWQQQRIVIELKVLHKSLDVTLASGLEQIADYMDKANATEGHLVIFDRTSKSWDEKVWQRPGEAVGRAITMWGM